MPVNDQTTVSTVFVADNQVCIVQDVDDMDYKSRKLEEYGKWGMILNITRTEYMCIGGQSEDLRLERGPVIKYCNIYKYQAISGRSIEKKSN